MATDPLQLPPDVRFSDLYAMWYPPGSPNITDRLEFEVLHFNLKKKYGDACDMNAIVKSRATLGDIFAHVRKPLTTA